VFRYGASPASHEALERMNTSIDVRGVLGVVNAPTLVIHQRADPWVQVEHGHYLAEHIPGAAYVELDGDEHIPTAAAAPQLLAHVIPFLEDAVSREAPEPDKVLATVLFSDIVGSTERAAELGNAQWRELLADHHARVRRQLARFRGVELDTAGDGFSLGSTARPAGSAVRWRSGTQCANWACRCAWGCTRASAKCSMAR
jgi:Adenylate and Guanylate cyclase catalytic domain